MNRKVIILLYISILFFINKVYAFDKCAYIDEEMYPLVNIVANPHSFSQCFRFDPEAGYANDKPVWKENITIWKNSFRFEEMCKKDFKRFLKIYNTFIDDYNHCQAISYHFRSFDNVIYRDITRSLFVFDSEPKNGKIMKPIPLVIRNKLLRQGISKPLSAILADNTIRLTSSCQFYGKRIDLYHDKTEDEWFVYTNKSCLANTSQKNGHIYWLLDHKLDSLFNYEGEILEIKHSKDNYGVYIPLRTERTTQLALGKLRTNECESLSAYWKLRPEKIINSQSEHKCNDHDYFLQQQKTIE